MVDVGEANAKSTKPTLSHRNSPFNFKTRFRKIEGPVAYFLSSNWLLLGARSGEVTQLPVHSALYLYSVVFHRSPVLQTASL